MMNNIKREKFVRFTADYTLRSCYKRLKDFKRAEEAFVEVYVSFFNNPLSNFFVIRKLVLKYEIYKICMSNF